MQYTLLKNINLNNTFEIDRTQLRSLSLSNEKNVTISLPLRNVTKDINLTKANIFSDNFNLLSSSGDVCGVDLGTHYRGKLADDENSIVSISFFNDQIHGHIVSQDGTFDINHHGDLIFSTDLVEGQPDFNCGTSHESEIPKQKQTSRKNTKKQDLQKQINSKTINPYITEVSTKLVRLDWEIEYDIFQVYGVSTWCRIFALFNASATLFANDGIQVVLSTLYGWDSFASPYINYYSTVTPGSSASGLGGIIRNYRKYWGDGNIPPGAQSWQFQGDLKHLLAISYPILPGLGAGGVSDGLGTLCNPFSTSITTGSADSPVVFSQLFQSQITTNPSSTVYTWNVNVVTHEQGHAFDSPHTFGCYWNVTNWTPGAEPIGCERIDSCRFENNTYSFCSVNGTFPLCIDNGFPVNGGTIMSYCHQIAVGVNFANGFGPQPQQRIVNFINELTCLCPTIQRDIDFTFTVTGDSIQVVNLNTVYPRMWVWDGMVSDTVFINELAQNGGVGDFMPKSLFTSGKIGLSFEWPLNCEVCFDINTLLPEPCFIICDNVTPTPTPTITQTPTKTPTIGFVTPTPTTTRTSTVTSTPTPTQTRTQTSNLISSVTPTTTQTPTPTRIPNNICTEPTSVAFGNGASWILNGITLTHSWDQNVTIITATGTSSYCQSNPTFLAPDTVANLGWNSNINVSGPFTYNIDFDVPVNNVQILYAGAGNSGVPSLTETFTFTTNTGTPSIVPTYTCLTTINGNVLVAGSGSTWSSPNLNTGTGKITINNSQSYTRLTIQGNGGSQFWNGAGTSFKFCVPSPTCCSSFRLDSSPSDTSGTTFLVVLCDGTIQNINVPTGTFQDLNCANNVSKISGLGTYIRYPGCICNSPTPTPTRTKTPVVPSLGVLLLYGLDIYTYQVSTNNQTFFGTLTFTGTPFFESNDITHTSSKIFVKGYVGIDFDDPNLICAIGEWNYTINPFSLTFVKFVELPDPIGEYPGLFAINNTTILTSTDTNTIPNGIVQINISSPTPTFTTILEFPFGFRTFGDYVLTTTGKLLVIVVDFNFRDKYIYQYDFTNLSAGPEITKILGDVLSERYLFEDNGDLYFLTNSSPSELYRIGLTPPYDLTQTNTLIFDFYSGASNTYLNSNVDLIPGGPSLTPTQTPTITPTPQPTNVGCAQCVNLHPCAISKFFVSCCEPFDTIRIYLIPYQVANTLVNGQSYFVEAVGFSNCAVYDENLNTANFSFEYINITPQ